MVSTTYRLPTSELVVAGTARITRDGIWPEKDPEASLQAVEFRIETLADLSSELTLSPPTGWLYTYKGSFATMPDGRLSSASSDVTGEGGTIVKAVASLAGAAAAVVLDDAPAVPVDDLDNPDVLNRYGPTDSEGRRRLTSLYDARKKQRAKLVRELTEDEPDPVRIRRLQTVLAGIDALFTPLEAAFRSWRESMKKSVDTHFEFRIPVDALSNKPPQEEWGHGRTDTTGGVPGDLKALWERYGYGVQAIWLSGAPTGAPQAAGSEPTTVYARRPSWLELRLFRQLDGAVVETGRTRYFVAHRRSVVDGYRLEKSWFGRKSLSLTFTADGFVGTVSTEGSSGVAGALGALAAVPDSFGTGVQSGTTAYTNLRAAGRARTEAATDDLKAQIDYRQQQLNSASLDSTAGNLIELNRLQQLQTILDLQTKIGATDPNLVSALAARTGGDLSWYQPPPTSEIQVVVSGSTSPATPPLPPPPALGGQ